MKRLRCIRPVDRAGSRMSAAVRIPLTRAFGFIAVFASCALGADDREGVAFFESKIRPVLVERCQECHSGPLKKPKWKLRLDTREGIRKGGSSGPAVVPGD